MRSLLMLCVVVASTYGFSLNKVVIDPTLNWRIIGGSNAPDGAYPHQVSLTVSGFPVCAGTIVHEEWVITAAHCVEGASPSPFKIYVGSNKLNSGGVYYQVLEVHWHEDFSFTTGLNDAAILKVEKIAFNEKVNKIAVETENIAGDVAVILSGWGATTVGGSIPNDLQHITLKSTSVQQCKDAHVGNPFPVEATHICTLTKVGEGSCHGDSGGPLIIDRNGDRKLVGIVSWGQPCAKGYPDVNTRVSSYVDWFDGKCKCIL